jgi:outer membrane receptor protein involved in Fe transport
MMVLKYTFLLLIILVAISSAVIAADIANSTEKQDYFSMSMEDLMNIPISTGSLTDTSRRKVPATTTTITREDIRRTGARNLDELLLITVPNLQQRLQTHFNKHLGLRGIISDRDDKYLILVNGRVMNERTYLGAVTERDLPLLTDIYQIDVIRGGGSALYGPGAIAMVINIITEDSRTFKGTEVTSRVGSIEEFYSGEFKHTIDLGQDEGIYLYAGASKYPGADGDDAPVYASGWYGETDPSRWDALSPSAYKHTTARWNSSFRSRPLYKLHAQYNKDDFELWTRFTQGGMTHPNAQNFGVTDGGEGYQQGTVFAKNTFELTDTLSLDTAFSYQLTDIDVQKSKYKVPDDYFSNDVPMTLTRIYNETFGYSEENYFSKAIFQWKPIEGHQLAFGTEYNYNKLGRGGYGWPGDDGTKDTISKLGKWETEMKSIVGEYQWNVNDWVTLFAGGRIDYHSYTDAMYSPRGALIFTPTEKDTIKLMVSRSTRTNLEQEMRDVRYIQGDHGAAPAELSDSWEIRYERQQTKNLWMGGSFFYQNRSPIAWNGTTNGPVGTIKSWGLEGEISYRTEKFNITASHSFTKLRSIELEPGVETFYSANQYGFGNDFACWDDHSTKLMATYFATDKLSIDSSLQMYWGSNGLSDYAKVREYKYEENGLDTSGYDVKTDIYDFGAFLNLGAEYNATKNLMFRFDMYNILGWIDKDYNQVPFIPTLNDGNMMQLAPAAVAVRMTYKF